jgi:hypothetical protein
MTIMIWISRDRTRSFFLYNMISMVGVQCCGRVQSAPIALNLEMINNNHDLDFKGQDLIILSILYEIYG